MEIYCNILSLQWKQSPISSIDFEISSLYIVFSLNGNTQKQGKKYTLIYIIHIIYFNNNNHYIVATIQLQYNDNSNIVGAIIPERFKLLSSLHSNDTINADLYTSETAGSVVDTLLGSGTLSIYDNNDDNNNDNDDDDEWKIKWLKIVSSSLLGSEKTICNIKICIQLEESLNINEDENINIINSNKAPKITGYKYASVLCILYFFLITLLSFQYMGYIPSITTMTSRHGLKVGKIHMNLGMDLSENHHIASCVGFSSRFCSPMYLYMDDTGSLGLHKGLYNPDYKPSTISAVWESQKLRKTFVPFRGEYSATITKNGELVISEGKKEIYSTNELETLKKYINFG